MLRRSNLNSWLSRMVSRRSLLLTWSYMHTCIHGYIHASMHPYEHPSSPAYINTYLLTCMHCRTPPMSRMEPRHRELRSLRPSLVCMYVCMHVCIYVCMYLCIYVCICIYVSMYLCMYVYVCMYVCMCVCVYVCIYIYIYIYVSALMDAETGSCEDKELGPSHVHANTCIHAYIHASVRSTILSCIHNYLPTYMHALQDSVGQESARKPRTFWGDVVCPTYTCLDIPHVNMPFTPTFGRWCCFGGAVCNSEDTSLVGRVGLTCTCCDIPNVNVPCIQCEHGMSILNRPRSTSTWPSRASSWCREGILLQELAPNPD